ncbi:MAG: tetratricopeptide repeat protein, partial [Planctomycetota bacterium]
ADAAQTYRRVLAANPSDRTARIHLARVLTALGRFDKAAEQYRLVLGETP